MKRKQWYLLRISLILVQLVVIFIHPSQMVHAAPLLTIKPITWNVIGLDSNNIDVGPTQFPVGARVCNQGDTQATNVSSEFVWGPDDTPAQDYLYLSSGTLSSYSGYTIDPGFCVDFYYNVEIERNENAYNDTRRYTITAAADGLSPVSTPNDRELFVEYLISQNRNSTTDILYGNVGDPIESMISTVGGGLMELTVGQSYDIVLRGGTATQGYNQLESYLNLPNSIFRIDGIKSTYKANSSEYVLNANDLLYADACLWDNVITSDTYMECIGSDGKDGGLVDVRYTVTVISTTQGTLSLYPMIYDFSGSSFHYNSDFESAVSFVLATSPLSLDKSFSPLAITTVDGTSTLTLNISNGSDTQEDNISVSDPLPSGMKVATTPNVTTNANCIGATFAPTAGDTSLLFTGSIAGNSTCTITVDVTTDTDGNFFNTAELFVDNAVTGITASDTLAVNTAGQTCTTKTLAVWTFPTQIDPLIDATAESGDLNSVSHATPANLSSASSTSAISGASTYAWGMDGFGTENNAFVFQVPNGEVYSDLAIEVSYKLTNSSWSNQILKIDSSIDNTLYTNVYSDNTIDQSVWVTTLQAVSADTTCSTPGCSTYFKVYAEGAQNNSSTMAIDDITITGCEFTDLEKPQLSKSFSPNSIVAGQSSTLTFTLTNPNFDTNLTNASFTDILPAEMRVASTPNASTTCSGASWAPEAGDTVLSFSGATILDVNSGGVCTAQVDVTLIAGGTFTNTSGFISTNETGINTNPFEDPVVSDPYEPGQGEAELTATIGAPQISKTFSPNPIALNGVSTLTFTITNPNTDVALTGVAFTDDYSSGSDLRNALSPNASTSCSGASVSLTAMPDGTVISLANAEIPAGGVCIVQVDVYAPTTGDKANLSGNVTSVNGGTGNTASDTLVVNPLNAKLALLKEISLNPNGPWASNVTVAEGTDVYYRFSIENLGDVSLSPVWISDPALSAVSSCSWPASLPAANFGDPVATCVIGPVSAGTSTSTNTATAFGSYSGSVYSSGTSSATYYISDLNLEKSVVPTVFSDATSTLAYTYVITNNGVDVSGSLSFFDSNSTVSCPAISSQGNLDNVFNTGESITCTSTYIITQTDRSIGYVNNLAYAYVGSTKTNTAKATAVADKPDLTISKAAVLDGGQAIQETPFTWTITISNKGGNTASFGNGSNVLTDTLPSNSTYNLPDPYVNLQGLTTNTGTLNCSIAVSTLTCSVNSVDPLVIESGESFTVDVEITPDIAATSLENTGIVDPDNVITEANEGNNTGVDTVPVSSSLPNISITKTNDVNGETYVGLGFSWFLTITNDGVGDIVFTDGQRIVTDELPTGPTYGSLVVTKTDVINENFLSCSIVGQQLSCTANGGSVTIPAAKNFVVEIPVNTSDVGTLNNQALVNPDFLFSESSTADNSATDSVEILSYIDLQLTKSVNDSTPDVGDSVTFTITVANTSDYNATGISVEDIMPSGYSSIGNISNSGTESGGTITWTGLSLAGNSSVDLTYTVTVLSTGNYENSAQVTAADQDDIDSTPGNADSTVEDDEAVASVSPNIDLQLTKTVNNNNPNVGDTVTFTVTIENTSLIDATGISVEDIVPNGYDTISNISDGGTESGSVITWAGLSLAAGASKDLTYTVTVLNSGAYENYAQITSADQEDTDSTPNNGVQDPDEDDDASASAVPNIDLELTKTVSDSTPDAGDTITFTVTIENKSTVNASGISVADNVPNGFDTIGNISDGGTESGGIVTWTGLSLAAGASKDLTFTVVVLNTGNYQNYAQITSADQTDTDSIPNNGVQDPDEDDDAFANVIPNIDLELTKAVSDSTPNVGDTITFTITVNNTSTVNGTGITIADVVPSGYSTTSSVISDSGYLNGSTIIWENLSLTAGSSKVLTYTVEVLASGNYQNYAFVAAADQNDTDSTPNNGVQDPDEDDDDWVSINFNLVPDAIDDNATVKAGESKDIDVLANDTQLGDTPTGITGKTDGAQGTVIINNNGTPGDPTDDTVVYTANSNAAGTDTFTYTICDSSTPADCDTATVTVTIETVQAPVLGVSKRIVGSPVEIAGETGAWKITFELLVKNYGGSILSGLQVDDDLSTAFTDPGSTTTPTTFSVLSLSSNEFTANINYDGFNNIHLLEGSDSLDPGAEGKITLVVRVVPAFSGTYYNSATASGTAPDNSSVSDTSMNGSNPDPDNDNDPTNNDQSTPIDFGTNVIDPPSGTKYFTETGEELLRWTAVWINQSNAVAVNTLVSDPIPEGSSFYVTGVANAYPIPSGAPDKSTNVGVICNAGSALTTTKYCFYEGPTTEYPRGRIIWQGNLGPDLGAHDENDAQNEISIIYSLKIENDTDEVTNIAYVSIDRNGDGIFEGVNEVDLDYARTTWPDDAITILPETGFPPNHVTIVPEQTNSYEILGQIWMEIPELDVRADIVGIQKTSTGWNLDWLGDSIGWLYGTAFPSWEGNSVVTAHVYNSTGLPGPFKDIKTLKYGDQVIVHLFGQKYIFEVRQSSLVKPFTQSDVFQHMEENSYLTLITCESFDPVNETYIFRRVVRAVLVDIQ